MLDMDGAGFNSSLGFSVKLSCDFFTSDDKVDNSSLMASGPVPVSISAGKQPQALPVDLPGPIRRSKPVKLLRDRAGG